VPVDVAAVGDASYQHQTVTLVDRVDDAIVAHADPVVVMACELDRARWARIIGERVDRGADSILEGSLEPTVGLSRLPMQPDVVAGRYSRTSGQGIA
jgi:hypothetical protein